MDHTARAMSNLATCKHNASLQDGRKEVFRAYVDDLFNLSHKAKGSNSDAKAMLQELSSLAQQARDESDAGPYHPIFEEIRVRSNEALQQLNTLVGVVEVLMGGIASADDDLSREWCDKNEWVKTTRSRTPTEPDD